MSRPPRVVLDTNVVVSALLFRQGPVTALRDLWRDGRFLPLIDRPCTEELLRVLAYPKFGLEPDDINALLEDYLPFAEAVPQRRVRVPRCGDPADRKFLVLAITRRAELLVTGDGDLLGLASRVPFEIVTPADFPSRLK